MNEKHITTTKELKNIKKPNKKSRSQNIRENQKRKNSATLIQKV
jgi:hypothetical protein